MRHPLWIVNSILLFFLIAIIAFIYFSRVTIPLREEIEPTQYTPIKKDKELLINISKIYENDLFGTYQPEAPVQEQIQVAFPEPPTAQRVEIPEVPTPTFLEPLNITLKGIFFLSQKNEKNRVIIADNKTNKEAIYQVGDVLEDAQIIRIYSNKVILLRSNGQQEVLYVREQDAKQDPMFKALGSWQDVVQRIADSKYIVDPKEFTERITNLGQFIDLLNLTSVYKEGKSIGTRIGASPNQSFAQLLGLEKGDVIISINDIPATTTENRFKIYRSIIKSEDEPIMVVVDRAGQEIKLEIITKIIDRPGQSPSAQTVTQESFDRLKEADKLKTMKQKYEFAPTLDEMRKREREMFRHGNPPTK